MGAYDNPKIIQQPDYGQIFSRNFQAGLSQQQAIKDRAEKRREKEKMQDQRLADRELAFATSIGKIEAGDLTTSLQRLGFSEADSYSENERLWADNKISRDEYSKNRSNSFRKIQELAQIGKSLELQSKNFDTLDESEFQDDPRSVGLIEAWKEKKMQFQYVGNEVEIYYNDGEKNVMVDIDDLKNNDFFNINQKVKLEDSEYANLAKIANPQIETESNATYDLNNTKTTTITKKYKQDKQIYIDQIVNSGKMAKLFSDEKQAGSLFVDTVHSKLKASNRLGLEADKLIKEYDIKDPDFKKAFINNIVYNNPKYRDMLDSLSKKEIATEAFDNHLPQSKRVFNAGGSSIEQAKPIIETPEGAVKGMKEARDSMNAIELKAPLIPGNLATKANRPIGSVLKEYNDTIASQDYRIIPGEEQGSYNLEYIGTDVKEASMKRNKDVEDITSLVKDLQKGNRKSFVDRLMARVYKETPRDKSFYKKSDKDVNLSAADLIKKYSN